MESAKCSRLGILAVSAYLLTLANAAVWGIDPPNLIESATRAIVQGGCHGTPHPGIPSMAGLLKQVKDSSSIRPLLPGIPCGTCPPIQVIKQGWCVLRPPGTDCSILPFDNNFYRIRYLHYYQCSAGVAICCSPWQEDNCCNNSNDEPKCEGGGATYQCTDATCP
jgi:hypothetical protein